MLKRGYIVVLALLLLSIIPYIHVFEEAKYFKVLSVDHRGPVFPETPSVPFISIYAS